MHKILVAIFGLSLAFFAPQAMEKVNFSGTWVMDKSKSEGVPADMEQTMTVTQDGNTIKQETKVVTDQGDQLVASTYVLDGKEMEYQVKRAIGDGTGKRMSRRSNDEHAFEVSEEETVNTANGPVVFKLSRKWTIAADARTLTIALDIDGPNGKQHTKRTFVKK